MTGITELKSAKDFYEYIVKPDCENYLKNCAGSIASAVHSCMALYHMREWFSASQGHNAQQSSTYWQTIKQQCPALEHARDVINSAKHVDPRTCQTVTLQREQRWEADIVNDTEHPVPYVVAILDDGTQYDIREIVSEGLAFWDQEISKLPS